MMLPASFSGPVSADVDAAAQQNLFALDSLFS
jgi:hypothetical protein